MVVARVLNRVGQFARVNRCPLRGRQPHSAKTAGVLTQPAVKHIEGQTSFHGHHPLPMLGIARRFYRCGDCFAVWAAGSRYERVAEDSVCGTYDHSLIWEPYPGALKTLRSGASPDETRRAVLNLRPPGRIF